MKIKLRSLRKKMLMLVVSVVLATSGVAQSLTVFEEWHTVSGTQNNFQRSIVRPKRLSAATYYYVCGSTLNSSGNYDILVQKKDASGAVLWSNTYNGAGNADDYATDVQIDGIGNVYVCGTYYKDATDSNNAVVIKYNNSGTHKWTKTYNGTGSRHDTYTAMQLSSNAIVAVGTTWKGSTTRYDILAVRLDTNGNQIWASTWDYAAMNDGAANLWVSGSNVFIAGGAQSTLITYKYAVVKLKATDGSLVIATVTGGTALGFDKVADFQMDLSGNMYIAGSVLNMTTMYDFKTVKLDTALNILWSATYDGGSNLNDFASGLCIDTSGNVIVTGCKNTLGSAQNYVTVKYSKTGVQRWVAAFDGGTNAPDSATAIAVRDTSQIYVTGYSYDSASVKNYYTIKYDGAGTIQWKIAFNSWGNGSDVATAIAVDSIGGIIVAGQSDVYGGRAYTTVRYIETQVITPPDPVPASNVFSFEENRGQLFNTTGNPETSIRYYNKVMNPSTYFSDAGASYVWARIDSVSSTDDTMHRVDMKLVGGNASRPNPMNKQANHFSYLQGYFDHPLPVVPLYSDLIYSEVYPKIDLMYSSNAIGLKHYFIMKVGGNAGNIEMEFDGADSIKIINDTLMVYTKLGVLKQRQATAFEIDNSGNRIALPWQPDYAIGANGNVKFINIGSYTSGRTLVFECDWGPPPSLLASNNSLEWSSYLGGASSTNDDSWEIVANFADRCWVCGTTTANPFSGVVGATTGPLTYFGGKDAFIASFDPTAHNLWIVYVGGSSNDEGWGLDDDKQGNAYLVGRTVSSNFTNLSTAGINYPNQGGVSDGYFIVIDPTGSIVLCDSYIGGNSGDQPRAIAINAGLAPGALDIYIVGATASTSNFPLQTGGGYDQTSYGGGNTDAFVMRLDQAYNNVWTSYFGGSGEDWYSDVALRETWNNEPVIVGWTKSSTPSANGCTVPSIVGDFPFCDNGGTYYSQVYGGGGNDAFIAEFSSTNQLVWSTYFGGSGIETGPGGINYQEPNVVISNNDVYLFGSCVHPGSNFPLLYSTNGGNFYQSATLDVWGFIARFNTMRQQTWTTLFGTTNMAVFGAFGACADVYGNVYFTGGCSIPGVVSSGNYCQVPPAQQFPLCNYSGLNYMETNLTQNPNNGVERTYIMAFNSSDNMIWGTLFGGSVENWGTGLSASFDKVYLSAVANNAYTVQDFNTSDPTDYLLITSPASIGNKVLGVSRFDITQITGVEENQIQNVNGISLIPNPASNTVNLSSSRPFETHARIQVVDIAGRVVIEQNVVQGEQNAVIDISGLANGMYTVQVENGGNTSSDKLIIHR